MVEVRTNILARLVEVLDPEYKTGLGAAKGLADVAATIGIAGGVAAAATMAAKGMGGLFQSTKPMSETGLGQTSPIAGLPEQPVVTLAQDTAVIRGKR